MAPKLGGDTMTAKEFLQQAYYAQQEVDMKLEQIERLQSLATRTTTVFKSAPSGSACVDSKIETAVIRIQEQINRLTAELTELLSVTEKVSVAIAQVKNPAEKKILKYRYLCFFSWKQISLLMKTSLRQIYRLHSQALENFFVGSQCH